jgi:hypothetical protein
MWGARGYEKRIMEKVKIKTAKTTDTSRGRKPGFYQISFL